MQENGSGSLASRAQARRQELLKRKTTIIEVPGWEGILAMEYRPLSYAELKRIGTRHENQRDDSVRDLYVAADTLIAASVEAYEIQFANGKLESRGMAWGRELAAELGVEAVEELTDRQCLFACFHEDVWVITHCGEYNEWLGAAHVETDEEQRQDFSPTT